MKSVIEIMSNDLLYDEDTKEKELLNNNNAEN